MRDTTTLYARLPAELVQLINARAKAMNSGYRSSKAYLEDGMKRFLERSPWRDSAPCFPTPRDVRTYSGGQTDWVAYNLILSRDVADNALEVASRFKVSKPAFVLGALLWWLEQSLGESGVSPSKEDLAAIAARHGLPLWSAPRGKPETPADSTMADQTQPRKGPTPDKPVRFKSADQLDIKVNSQTLEQIDEVIRSVEGRSKSGRLVATDLLTAISSLGNVVNVLGPDADGTKIECIGPYAGEADPALRYYATAATMEYRNDKVWHLVKVLRKAVRAKEGGMTTLKYTPRGRVALGMDAGRAINTPEQQLTALLRKRFANDDLYFWVGLMHSLVSTKRLPVDQAQDLLLWRGGRSPDGAARLKEAFEALTRTSDFVSDRPIHALMLPSGPITEDQIALASLALLPPMSEEARSENLEGKVKPEDLANPFDF